MIKIQIALCKGTGLVSSVIKWWTRSKYSHVALILNEKVMFASVPNKGTMFIRIWDKSDYDTFDVLITEEQYSELFKYCTDENGCDYDWIGIILSQIVAMNRESDTKWFCSEFVISALIKIGVSPNVGLRPSRFSPEDIHKFIINYMEKNK